MVTAAVADNARLVVGLGNPGRRYDRTRHNVGYRVVDVLAQRWGATGRSSHDGLLYDARVDRPGDATARVLLLKPQTFMNRSGQSVASVAHYYRLNADDILVVLDDIALPVGKIRVRAQGTAGGHKGLSDVMQKLGTETVARLRIGVGIPPTDMAAEDYVLSRFTDTEDGIISSTILTASDAATYWVFEGSTAVMNRYNPDTPDASPEATTNESSAGDAPT